MDTKKTQPSVDQAPLMPELAPDDDVAKLLERYVASVRAFTLGEPGADERLLRAVEWLMDIPTSRSDEFRREIMNDVGAHQRLDAALEKLLLARKS